MFQLTVLTPEKKLLVDEEVDEVFVPGYTGEMHVLENHAPMMTVMQTGVLRYVKAGEEKKMAISWGYAEVSPAGMNVLAETAETSEEIDLDRAKKAEQDSAKALEDQNLDGDEIEKHLRKIQRAQVRQDISH